MDGLIGHFTLVFCSFKPISIKNWFRPHLFKSEVKPTMYEESVCSKWTFDCTVRYDIFTLLLLFLSLDKLCIGSRLSRVVSVLDCQLKGGSFEFHLDHETLCSRWPIGASGGAKWRLSVIAPNDWITFFTSHPLTSTVITAFYQTCNV